MVIPLWNGEKFVRQALRSVELQSLTPDEVIVIDDESLDSGPRIVRDEFPGFRLVTIENGGPGAARNHGVRVASSEWVAFLDADDEWYPWHLENLVRTLDLHPSCLFGSARSVFAVDRPSLTQSSQRRSESEASYFEVMKDDIRAVNSSSTMVHRETFVAVGGCSAEYAGEDLVGWIRMGLRTPVVRSDVVSVFVRRNPESIMGTRRRRLLEGVEKAVDGGYAPSVESAMATGPLTTLSRALTDENLPPHVTRRSLVGCWDSLVRGHIRANTILGVESRSWCSQLRNRLDPRNMASLIVACLPVRISSALARLAIRSKDALRSRRR